jgi:hypothetical protein
MQEEICRREMHDIIREKEEKHMKEATWVGDL